MSLSPPDLALSTRFGRTMFPRFNRIDVGSNNRISLANVPNLLDGSVPALVCHSVFPAGLGLCTSRSCDQYPGIHHARQLRILVVKS